MLVDLARQSIEQGRQTSDLYHYCKQSSYQGSSFNQNPQNLQEICSIIRTTLEEIVYQGGVKQLNLAVNHKKPSQATSSS
jgi:hypothetical protein